MKYSKRIYLIGIVMGLMMSFQNCAPFKPLGAVGLDSLSTSPALNFAIDMNPQSLTVPAGSNVIFSVQAHGSDILHYAWYFSNSPIPNSDASFLSLPNVTAASMGYYFVIVTQGTGVKAPVLISQTAMLTISGTLPPVIDQGTPNPPVVQDVAPAIASQPSSATVTDGSPFSFVVNATGTNPQYQWYFNSSPIAGANQSVYSSTANANTAGSYYVVIKNNSGSSTSQTVTLTVNPQVPTGVPLQQQIFFGDTGGCSFTAADVSYTAPISGSYTFYTYVTATASYYFILPYFSLLDSSGAVLQKFTLTNEHADNTSTFFNTAAQSMSAVVQLTQGQTVVMRQYYSVRWCYDTQSSPVQMGLSQIYYGNLPVFGGCGAQDSLPASPPLTITTTSAADGLSGSYYFCMPNGQWQKTYDWHAPPPTNVGTGYEGGN